MRLVDIYPGITLEIDGYGGHWSWRLILPSDPAQRARAEAALAKLKLRIEGAQSVSLAGNSMHIVTSAGAFTLPLITVQEAGGQAVPLSLPTVSNDEVSAPFRAPADDDGSQQRGSPTGSAAVGVPSLMDSPDSGGGSLDSPADLLLSTFLGGDGGNPVYGLAIDDSGAIYVAGATTSANFSTGGSPHDPSHNGGSDVTMMKLNAAGSALVYATYIGGSSHEGAYALALDADSNAYITGRTESSDLPTPNGYDTTLTGTQNPFLFRVNAAGTTLDYGTYLVAAQGFGVAVQPGTTDIAYIVGQGGSGFPATTGAYDTTANGDFDGFIAKFDTSQSSTASLAAATFLGSSGSDCETGGNQVECDIAVDASGGVHVAGMTHSSGFPTTVNASDGSYNGNGDAFYAVLDDDLSSLQYGTFLGSTGQEICYDCSITLDALGSAYLAGQTTSTTFPTVGDGIDDTFGGGIDTFVAKLSASQGSVVYATYLGGSGNDGSTDIIANPNGSVNIIGSTDANDFPTTAGALQQSYAGGSCGGGFPCRDITFAKLKVHGTLMYATYLGLANEDFGRAIGVRPGEFDAVYLGGETHSEGFPVTAGAYDTVRGPADGFLLKLNTGADTTVPDDCCNFRDR